jgi:hypothetical protein
MDVVRRLLNVTAIVASGALVISAVVFSIDSVLYLRSKQSIEKFTNDCISEWQSSDLSDRPPLDVNASAEEEQAWIRDRSEDRIIAEGRCEASYDGSYYTPNYQSRPPVFTISIALFVITLTLNYILFGKARLWNRLSSPSKSDLGMP